MKISSADELIELGRGYAARLKGGDVIELVGDVGVGKTTFTQGVALGMGVKEPISSPSFTIMKSYPASNGLKLNHYDFYRLDDAGIMKLEINDSVNDPTAVTVVEWAKDVTGVLPKSCQVVEIKYLAGSEGREVLL